MIANRTSMLGAASTGARLKPDWHVLQGTEAYGLMKKYAKYLLVRNGSLQTVNEVLAGDQPALAKRWQIFNKGIAEWGVMPLADMENWSVATGWMTAFDAASNYYTLKGMGAMEAERSAAEYANKVMLKTQSTPNPHEKSLFERESEWVTNIAPFSSYFFKLYGHIQQDIFLPLLRSDSLQMAGKQMIGGDGKLIPGTFQQILFSFVIPAMLSGLINRRRPPDEEEFWQDMMVYGMSGVPVLGSPFAFSIMSGQDVKMGLLGLQPITWTLDAAKEVYRAENKLDATEPATKALAAWTGMPQTIALAIQVMTKAAFSKGGLNWTPELKAELAKALAVAVKEREGSR
jgi:hypothetical protein